jgi:hypothetical protein
VRGGLSAKLIYNGSPIAIRSSIVGLKDERPTSNIQRSTFDGFVKSLKTSISVIPAKAGIQYFQLVLDACLRRHDGASDFLRFCQCSSFDVLFFNFHHNNNLALMVRGGPPA